MARSDKPKLERHRPGMKPVTIRLPRDILDAIDVATAADGYPTTSDTVRAILDDYMRRNGYYSKDKQRRIDKAYVQQIENDN